MSKARPRMHEVPDPDAPKPKDAKKEAEERKRRRSVLLAYTSEQLRKAQENQRHGGVIQSEKSKLKKRGNVVRRVIKEESED